MCVQCWDSQKQIRVLKNVSTKHNWLSPAELYNAESCIFGQRWVTGTVMSHWDSDEYKCNFFILYNMYSIYYQYLAIFLSHQSMWGRSALSCKSVLFVNREAGSENILGVMVSRKHCAFRKVKDNSSQKRQQRMFLTFLHCHKCLA